jgi:aryl-alcohol dehydrogenase-like predicted oxidoreductase
VIHAALDAGINFLDTADSYGNRGGSETCVGLALGDRRKDVVLATKFGNPMADDALTKGASRRYIVSAVEASLRRLKTDWIDLYQLHRPDPATPIDETLRALDDLVRSGKVRYIGCSNLPAWQLVDARWTSRTLGVAAFVTAQDEFSLLVRGAERDLLPALRAQGVGLLPFFPLANGLLTGKYGDGTGAPASARLSTDSRLAERYLTERNLRCARELQAFCMQRGRTMVELAFSWLAAQSAVASIIAGATSGEQVAQNARAAHWRPSAEELAEIDRIVAPG